MIAQRAIAGQAKVKRRMGIQRALEWAFGRECALLDLDASGTPEGRAQPPH